MAKKSTKKSDPGKKRTREHIIADLSLVHVQFFIVCAGFTSEATTKDYGYDLTVNTFDEGGIIEPGAILIQLKASEELKVHADGHHYIFDLEVKDYKLWAREPNPVFLILYEAKSQRAYWLYFQQYVRDPANRKPRPTADWIRLKIPMTNRVRTSFFRHGRHLKVQRLEELMGDKPHD